MDTVLLHSLWGFDGDLEEAITRARRHGFDGLDANLRHPALKALPRQEVASRLADVGLALVVELVSGGDHVPDLALGPEDHLRELAEQLEACAALAPLQVTLITGSDSWPWEQQQAFFERALALVEASGLSVSVETHRSRSLSDPWRIQTWLEAFPSLRLTADISHWCVASERLMTPELDPIAAIAHRVDHIHARVGHAQGPQVSHPFAPEHARALAAHRACWELFAADQRRRGRPLLTLTPEFGPDGYLPTLPFTDQPVADLLAVNTAMAAWLSQLFPGDAAG